MVPPSTREPFLSAFGRKSRASKPSGAPCVASSPAAASWTSPPAARASGRVGWANRRSLSGSGAASTAGSTTCSSAGASASTRSASRVGVRSFSRRRAERGFGAG